MNKTGWTPPRAHNDQRDQTDNTKTSDRLPGAASVRWVRSRKAAVVLAIADGFLTAEEAQARYHLSPEELANWQDQFAHAGENGLSMKALVYNRIQT